jgi:hypothetical protein
MGDAFLIQNIKEEVIPLGSAENPATSATELLQNGINTTGWYYINGINDQSTVYQIYCDFDRAGGAWMLLYQIPKGFTTNVNSWFSYSNSTNNSVPGAENNNNTFVLPITKFSANGTGTDLDVYAELRVSTTWRRNGAYFRGFPINPFWRDQSSSASFSAPLLQSSGDGINFAQNQTTLRFSSAWDGPTISADNGTNSYLDTNPATAGFIWHDENNWNNVYGWVEVANTGAGGAFSNFTHGRIWIRVN